MVQVNYKNITALITCKAKSLVRVNWFVMFAYLTEINGVIL